MAKTNIKYDLENQIVHAEIKKPAGNTDIWTYDYDSFGRRLFKERQDKLAWTSTDPKRTHFVWDGTRLLQEYIYKGCYTYICTDQGSYEPLAQVFHNNQDEGQYLAYFHNDQIGIPREMTDIHGNLFIVRRIHRLGSSEKGRAGLQKRASTVQTAKLILR